MSSSLSILFIVITVMIDAMGIGLIMPVMPDLLREVQGGTLADAALWGGVLAAAFSAMQFLFGPLLGALSDRFGRRPVLLISLVVMAADYLVMAVAGTVWLLLLGRIVGGITAATHATAAAYVADISAPDDKAANFGLIGAGFGVGFVLGPVLGGLLAEYGTRAPFFAAAGLAALNAGFGYLVLRETVTDAIRRRFDASRANPLGALRSVAGFPGLGPLLMVFFLYHVATAVYPAVWSYFTIARFGWSPGMIGVSLAVYGLFFALVQGLLVRPSIRVLGHRRTVRYGLVIEAFSMILLAWLTSGLAVLILIPITAIGAVGLPALQGIMSRAVRDDNQGELQGVLTSLTSLASVAAPLAMTQVFAFFTGPHTPLYQPGAPFLFAFLLMLLCIFVFQRRRVSTAP